MKTLYIIAVKAKIGNELYQFSTKKDRAGFIKDLENKIPGIEYATSEMKVK